MPLPRLVAHINKRVYNPMEVRLGARPVLIPTGRSSGKTYRTLMDAHRLPDACCSPLLIGVSIFFSGGGAGGRSRSARGSR